MATTKKAIKAALISKLQTSDELVRECIVELAKRQTEDELVNRDTKHKNRRGFSSSNAYWGTKYAEVFSTGATLESDDMDRARRICTFHAKQLVGISLGLV